ncbi:hypothetical protein [Streptomyces sp. H27-D2]|uniref:hypothetical protein n=1 Tax=Streptomyces sp. H27-D2 TaxID=3046304 RepID=UPI002DBD24C1|nr:hypothetical protein [Streptomyces sp. H27-D2]MEC4015978.1 hypothetical protein [Streptomyces sp. H27-D2]
MSYGDPNNPYSQPPQGQQPGQQQYGYPQQQPGPPPGQPYGQFPQQGGQPQYGGYPGGPMGGPQKAPGTVTTARVLLFVLGGLMIIASLALFAVGAAAQNDDVQSAFDDQGMAISGGLFIGLGVLVLAIGILEIIVAAKFGKGGNGVRVTAIVIGAILTVGYVVNLFMGNIVALLGLAASILIIVYCAKADAKAWFNRPRY